MRKEKNQEEPTEGSQGRRRHFKRHSVVSAGSDGREKSDGVKAEERPMDLPISMSLTTGLAPTSKLRGPWESPGSGRQFRKLFLKF